MKVSVLDCIFVNLGIFQHNNEFIHRGANARHVSTVTYVTIRVIKNTFIKNGRISCNNKEEERVRLEIREMADLFLSSYTEGLPSHKSTNKAGRLPHLLRQLRLSFASREENSSRWSKHGLAKTRSQMIDLVKRWCSKVRPFTYESRHVRDPCAFLGFVRDTVKFQSREGSSWSQRTFEIVRVLAHARVCDVKCTRYKIHVVLRSERLQRIFNTLTALSPLNESLHGLCHSKIDNDFTYSQKLFY